MPKGGHANSGPAPDPNALRRQRPADQAGWTVLPLAGYSSPPEWPLVDPSERELELWREMWSRPQATMWDGQQVEVAMFVRSLAEAELPGASVERQKVIRQYLDSLGLSVQGMLRHRWKMADPDDEEPSEGEAPRKSSRARLTVVSDDGD